MDRKEAIVKHLFSSSGNHLASILKLDSAFLAGLVAFSFALPLPKVERWLLVLSVAAVAGRDWIDVAHTGGR